MHVCIYIYFIILFVLCVHTHMSAYMCVGTSIVVRAQLVEVTRPPSTVWVLGMELSSHTCHQAPLPAESSLWYLSCYILINPFL